MKTRLLSFVLISLLPACLLEAEGPGFQNSGRMNGTGLQGAAGSPGTGMSSLENILHMDDEQLEQLEALVRRIRQMTPEERAAYLQKLRQYQEMAPQQRLDLQSAWGRIDERVRQAWREYMLSLDIEKRQAVHREMQEVPFEDRTRWRVDLLVRAGLLTPDEAGIEPRK